MTEKRELMEVPVTPLSSCKKEKFSLYFSLAGRTYIISEPLSSCWVYPIGMTRLLSTVSSAHLCPSHRRKSIFLIPWNSGLQNSINYTGYLSCKSSSSSLFRLSSIPQSIVEISENGIILSGRDSCKEESHLEPFVPLPCHFEIDYIFTRLINHRVETDITNKVLGCWESLYRVSNLCDYSCNSDFTEPWDGKEDMLRILGIHNLINFPFQLFNLEIELEDSLSGPANLISEDKEIISLKDVYKSSEGTGGRDIFKIRVRREETEEILSDFLSDHSFISWEDNSEVFSEAVNTSCFLIEEDSSESCKGAELELVGRERGRGLGRESFKVSGNYLSIDSICFREDEVSFSELRDAVRVNNCDSKSFRSSTNEEIKEGDMVISSSFHTDCDMSFFTYEAGESEGISSKESEAIRGIWIFSGWSDFSLLTIHEIGGKGSGTDIHTDKKSFIHDITSIDIFYRVLVAPPFSEGNYPPGLRAFRTSCNQISPSECGEPSSMSCSRHTQNEGLPDTLIFYSYNRLKMTCK